VCGILTISGLDSPYSHRLLESLRRRGPDGIGFWCDPRVQMGHSRLRIIGLDERALEPMEDRRHVLNFNGEIYNFQEIRRRLDGHGVDLTGANDAEVLLHAWTRWGADILPELVGFWAFVVYDKLTGRLTLVRDQYGVKPLYYWQSGESLCIASMIKTVLEVLGSPPELDYEALSEYVRYQFTFGDKTFFRGIKKVLPGHMVEIDPQRGTVSSRCWEDILAPPEAYRRRITDRWIETTRELLQRSVQESTISDTPVTTFCSGGLDSSLITRLAAPEITYHCNFSDPECNETRHAKRVVEEMDTRLFVVNAQESFNLVERLADIIDDFDELSIGSVVLPLDDLLSQVKRRFKVILSGIGGDELFAGYVRYPLALGRCDQDSYLPLFHRMAPLESPAERFELAHTKGDTSFYRFYDHEVRGNFFAAYDACRQGEAELNAMLRFDRRYFLGGLLNIEDKMCGRHSLESRPSLLHQHLARHLLAVEPRVLLRDGELKWLMRRAAQPFLPESILRRRDKMGFTTPVGSFVNRSAHLVREQLTGSRFAHLYDIKGKHLTADGKFSREVFGLLMLDLWLNRYAA
jgi:asparagine synthase (glutamine-hydrolysing)